MPGSRRLCTYSALPVTLSHDSSRGTERPTCGVSVACVARFIHGPLQVDPQQLLLVFARTVQIALDPQRLGRLQRGEPCRLVGRRADDDGRLVAVQHYGDAERRPVVRGSRRALEVSGALLAERRDLHLGDELPPAQGRLEITAVERFHARGTLAPRPGDGHGRAERG